VVTVGVSALTQWLLLVFQLLPLSLTQWSLLVLQHPEHLRRVSVWDD